MTRKGRWRREGGWGVGLGKDRGDIAPVSASRFQSPILTLILAPIVWKIYWSLIPTPTAWEVCRNNLILSPTAWGIYRNLILSPIIWELYRNIIVPPIVWGVYQNPILTPTACEMYRIALTTTSRDFFGHEDVMNNKYELSSISLKLGQIVNTSGGGVSERGDWEAGGGMSLSGLGGAGGRSKAVWG